MERGKRDTESKSIYRIPPYYYLHVLDQNSNVTKMEIGPKTFIRQDNEKVILGPEKMIVVPPRHYCIVENPAIVGDGGSVVLDSYGQVSTIIIILDVDFMQARTKIALKASLHSGLKSNPTHRQYLYLSCGVLVSMLLKLWQLNIPCYRGWFYSFIYKTTSSAG